LLTDCPNPNVYNLARKDVYWFLPMSAQHGLFLGIHIAAGAARGSFRPLATVEPTAIQFQMPVQSPCAFAQIDKLGQTLVAPAHRGKLVVIAWEHKLIEKLVRQLLAAHGDDASAVAHWPSGDVSSIYIVKLDWRSGEPRATFKHDNQGRDGRAADCPCAALPNAPLLDAA
jgi:hypothetical protein